MRKYLLGLLILLINGASHATAAELACGTNPNSLQVFVDPRDDRNPRCLYNDTVEVSPPGAVVEIGPFNPITIHFAAGDNGAPGQYTAMTLCYEWTGATEAFDEHRCQEIFNMKVSQPNGCVSATHITSLAEGLSDPSHATARRLWVRAYKDRCRATKTASYIFRPATH